MKCCNQGCKLFFFYILQFIDKDCECGIRSLRRLASRHYQCREIVLKIAVVSEPRLRLEVEPDFDIVILHF